jgi:molecular chaperone GrpE
VSDPEEDVEVAGEPSIQPSQELEEALREALASVDQREAARKSGGVLEAADAVEPQETDVPAEAEAPAEVAALRDQLLRLHADFENLRRRTLREKEEAFRYGHENIVKDLLPTVDNLERAVDHARQSEGGDVEGLLAGVELVLRELRGVFDRHGVEEIEAEGKPFDPSVHEAMAQAPDDTVPANTVVQVYQRGYQLRDHLIRPARVVVSKPSQGGDETSGPTSE